ncbi:hypothetical protein [Flammeovirga sp. SubArs3]|uniref:hypothetical protein n=1 Tax=Flammeovirga sp. SubArs3 TaxID=2995316 RepID=UPI00248BDE71|nr:hypothetical protein [Flammeovirga sp. SubArs3]
MKKIIPILIFLLINNFSYSQSYLTSEVISKAEFYLKEAVGVELFKYFTLAPHSYYHYKNKKGKSKWREISKGKKTRGTFVDGKNINFVLNHPDFSYPYVRKIVYVELNSDLELIHDLYIDQIPKFLLENKPSNWLTEDQLDQIIKNQNLKKISSPLTKRLNFDSKMKSYYWIVWNTLYEEEYFSDEEILHIDAVTGVVLKHFEERQYFIHCY